MKIREVIELEGNEVPLVLSFSAMDEFERIQKKSISSIDEDGMLLRDTVVLINACAKAGAKDEKIKYKYSGSKLMDLLDNDFTLFKVMNDKLGSMFTQLSELNSEEDNSDDVKKN